MITYILLFILFILTLLILLFIYCACVVAAKADERTYQEGNYENRRIKE